MHFSRQHGQRPAPAGEFSGDRDVGDDGRFLRASKLPPGMQASVARVARGPVPRGGLIPAAPQRHTGPVGAAVVPGRFDQQPADVPVAGLGDRALRRVIAPEEYSLGTNPR